MNEIASRYGLALFSLALEQNKVLEYQAQLKELRSVFKQNADFVTVLDSAFLPLSQRLHIVSQTLVNIDDEIVNLIKIVITNNRARYLFDIFDSFNSFCNEERGIKEGLVYSTIPLDEKVKSQIEAKISKIEHCNIELTNHLDSTLIGGVKVVIDGRIYDGSINSQIEKMKSSLLGKEGHFNEN